MVIEVKEMLTQARQKLIENYVNERGLCRVTELCKLTNSSESTIRRDLIQLEEAGIIKRVHGGAQSVQLSRDVSQHVRFDLNHEDKVQIAKLAAGFVKAGDNIFIDAGTTTYEMVQFLENVPDLTIVTNGVETALCSLNHGIETILIGGKVKQDTHASVGQDALRQIKAMNFTASFVGTNGISRNGDLTTPDPEEAAIKRAELSQAKSAYVLADATKFDKQAFAVFGRAQDVIVVTNKLKASQKKKFAPEIRVREVEI